MDKTTLVDKDLHDALELIKSLESEQLEIHSALWLYDSEVEEWRLIIATPLYDEEGPRKTFSFILNVLDEIDPPLNLALSNISVISPLDELIQDLGYGLAFSAGLTNGIRISRNMINGHYIEDAYIYKLSSSESPAV